MRSPLTAPSLTAALSSQVQLHYPAAPPEPLWELLSVDSVSASDFLAHIRGYNNALAFASSTIKVQDGPETSER